MTTHNDQTTPVDPMEARLRAMLAERATDVEATPALFEDVRARASRGTFVRRAVGGLAVAAALTGGALVLPGLLSEPQIAPIAPAPEESTPTESSTIPGAGGAPMIADLGDEYAVTTTDGIFFRNREQLSEQATILSLGGHGVMQARVLHLALVSELNDGSRLVGVVDTSPDGDGVGGATAATPNGDAVVMSPDGQAVAWIEGSNLHIWPVGGDDASIRVLPLDGADTPGDLVIEQWFSYADAPLILASRPGGGMWTIPMDESNVFNTGPVGDPFPSFQVGDADDAIFTQDGSTISITVAADGQPAMIQVGDGTPMTLPAPYVSSTDLELEAGAGGGITLLDRAGDGTAALLRFEGADQQGRPTIVTALELGTGLTGAVTMGVEDVPDTRGTPDDGQTNATLGYEFETNQTLLGTDGVALVEYGPNGDIARYDLYPPAESEAVLGRIAVRPGSSFSDAQFAVESFSEGETSVRFGRLQNGVATPDGDILVTNGEVTGLVWSPDGREIAWTTASGLSTARVADDLTTTLAVTASPNGPVVDWFWTDAIDGRMEGLYVTGTPNGDSSVTSVQRFTNGQLSILESTPTTYFHDMHARGVTSEGPSVVLRLTDGTLRLSWGGDGDVGDDLLLPDALAGSDGASLRMKVSGGQVLLISDADGAAWQVLVDGDSTTATLPTATDWDILD